MEPEFEWLALDDDEVVVWSETPHPYSLVPAVVVGLLLAVVLVGVVIVVGAYLSHRNTNYVVTSDALYKKTGVLSRNVQRIEFGKVQDTSYRQSFLGGRYGYGTVDISTAGGGGVEMSFTNVAEPRQVQSLINDRLRSVRDRADADGRDANEVLSEILTELRAIRVAVGGEEPPGGEETTSDGAGRAEPETSPEAASIEAVDDPTGRRDVIDRGRDHDDEGAGADDGEEGTDHGDDRPAAKDGRTNIQFEDGS